MYSICTVFVRFRSVQILYIYCTYTVQRAERVLEIKVLRVPFLAVSARGRPADGVGEWFLGCVVGGGMLTSWLFLGSEMGLNSCGTARKTRFCCFCLFFACFLDFSSLAVPFLRPVCGFGGVRSKFFFVRNGLLSSRCWKIFGKKRKKILVEWKMVVFLHSLSPRGRGC